MTFLLTRKLYISDIQDIHKCLMTKYDIIRMLNYDRIGIFEDIHINKTSNSHESKICHYWYFFKITFSYQPLVCNGYQNIIQRSTDFNDVVIAIVKENDYKICCWSMRERNAVSIMKNPDLS